MSRRTKPNLDVARFSFSVWHNRSRHHSLPYFDGMSDNNIVLRGIGILECRGDPGDEVVYDKILLSLI